MASHSAMGRNSNPPCHKVLNFGLAKKATNAEFLVEANSDGLTGCTLWILIRLNKALRQPNCATSLESNALNIKPTNAMGYNTPETPELIDASLSFYDKIAFNYAFYTSDDKAKTAYSEYKALFFKLAPEIIKRCRDKIPAANDTSTVQLGGWFELSILPGVTWRLERCPLKPEGFYRIDRRNRGLNVPIELPYYPPHS